MKKILVLVLVALVALALVACGGESATTTKGADTTATPGADTTATPGADTTATPGADTTKTPGDTTKTPGDTTKTPGNNDTPNTTETPDTQQGIDILNGEPENMAIDPTWKGIWACAFENHHPELNYEWCFVIKMIPTDNFIQEDLIAMDEETGFGIAFDDFIWTLNIDGTDYVIETFNIPARTGFIYVRMGLGADWWPVIGEHEYEIKLTITSADTHEVAYYANFTDPEWSGPYYFEGEEPLEVIPTEKPDDIEVLPTGALTGIRGPESLAAAETYVRLFDGLVQTKLCSSDYDNPLIFTVNDSYSLRGISLVGANDDEKFPERVPVKFKLYGSTDGSDGSWEIVLDVNQSIDDITVINYAERYFGFSEAVDYTYFKLEIEDASGAATPKYQYSEILLFTDKQ